MLYPHPRGLPIRHGLKHLAIQELGRTIQAAGEQGHDSEEDAVATSDLVLKKVEVKWREMVKEGWKWEGDRLLRPTEDAEPSVTALEVV